MLTRFIVDLYAWIIEIALWFMLLIAAVVGYNAIVPMLETAGGIVENGIVWKIFGALVFPVVTFLVSAFLIGPFLVLVDIRKSVRAFEMWNSGKGGTTRVLPTEQREPHL